MYSSKTEDMNKYYLNEVLSLMPRLLSLLDRRPFSSTRGSFDKSYWHFKTSDFSNAAAQMGMETMARVWNINDSSNPYYKNENILNLTKCSLLYTVSIQHNDGSYDEWYYNERGWAGPTGYVLQSVCKTYQIIKDHLSEKEKSIVIDSIKRSCLHLDRRDEKNILANHIAVTIMSLTSSYEILQSPQLKDSIIKWWKFFQDYSFDEGWSLEYDGIDFGYNFASISFLSRTLNSIHLEGLEEYIYKSFNYLQYFFYPDGTFGGSLGSRNTEHLYPFAIEFWKEKLDIASRIDSLLKNKKIKLIPPSTQDDHYIMYRTNDYLEAYELHASKKQETSYLLPFEKEGHWTKEFKESGIIINKGVRSYFVSNLKKGGAFYYFNLNNSELNRKDSGLIGSLNGKLLTSSYSSNDWKATYHEKSFSTENRLEKVDNKLFNPLTSSIFKIVVMFLGSSTFLSYKLKSIIRSLLIVGRNPEKNIHYRREIIIQKDNIKVVDSLKGKASGNIMIEDDFTLRYVPQSQYFTEQKLSSSPKFHYKNKNTDFYLEREFEL